MKVLVTGINGFTGRYVKKELEEHGHTVIGLRADITNLEAVDKEIEEIQPEAVVHLAGIAYVAHNLANPIYEVNLIGTRNFLQALAKYCPKIQSILLASSANVYGNSSQGNLTESTLAAPTNDYAVSKYSMELMAHLWMDQLPLFIARPFNYTGVGQNQRFLIPKIIAHFQQKKPTIELGNIEVWREFGDVRNVANSYRKLLELSPRGKTINICTGKTYSLLEVLSICEKITGHQIKIEVNPQMIRANEVSVLKGDSTYLQSLIGDLHSYHIEDTLRWMMQGN